MNKLILTLLLGIFLLGLGSAGTIDVTLNSPADDSTTYTFENLFNASATTDATNLVNMSLWTNETGSWEIYNTTIPQSVGTTETATADGSAGSDDGNFTADFTAAVRGIISNVGFASGDGNAKTTRITISQGGDILAQGQTTATGYGSVSFTVNDYSENGIIEAGTFTIRWERISGTGTILKSDSTQSYSGTFFSYTNQQISDDDLLATSISFKNVSAAINTTQTWNRTITDDIIWNVQTCDSDNTCSFSASNYTLYLDSTAPTISISSPESIIDTHIIGNNLWLNTTITDTNLEACWYEYNDINTTFSCTSGIEATEEFSTVEGKQSIKVWANDSIGNVNSEEVSWTYNFLENSATYDATAYETSQETLSLNFTTDITIQSISANLNYDGEEYLSVSSCDGNTCTLNNTIDIPILTGGAVNNTFYWEFTIFNGTSSTTYNSTSRVQEIEPIFLIECNATYPVQTLNFTAYDEGNLTRLNPFSFDGSFSYWLGDGSTSKTYNLANSSTNEINLCISANETFYVNATIQYDSTDLGSYYLERTYYFREKEIDNSSEDIELLLLNSEDSTSFIQSVLREQIGVANVLIYTYRYYAGLDEYKITQITRTDNSGQTVGFYESETGIYKHTLYENENIVLQENEGYKIIPSSTPYTLTFYLGSEVNLPWSNYDNETGVIKSLTFNNNTKIVTYNYVDTNSSNEGGRLLVYNLKYATADNSICNSTSSLSSAVINCDLTSEEGGFLAQAFVIRNGEEILVDSIVFEIDDKIEIFGEAGMLLAWFIILVAAMAFIYDAIIGLIAINLAIIFVNLIGFVSFGITYIIGILIVSITVIWLLKK